MRWTVTNHDAFDAEYDHLPEPVQDELLAMAGLLELYGPRLGRPHADTLAGSRHANMKELRFNAAGGAWRVAFAFDPARQAILLVAGDKAGVAQKRFYKALIAKATSGLMTIWRRWPQRRNDYGTQLQRDQERPARRTSSEGRRTDAGVGCRD